MLVVCCYIVDLIVSIFASLLKLGSGTLLPGAGVADRVGSRMNFMQRFPVHGIFLGTVLDCSIFTGTSDNLRTDDNLADKKIVISGAYQELSMACRSSDHQPS